MSFNTQYQKLKRKSIEINESNESKIKQLDEEYYLLCAEIDMYERLVMEKRQVKLEKSDKIQKLKNEITHAQTDVEMFRQKFVIFSKEFQPLGFCENTFQMIFEYASNVELTIILSGNYILKMEIGNKTNILREDNGLFVDYSRYFISLSYIFGNSNSGVQYYIENDKYLFPYSTDIIDLKDVFGQNFNAYNILLYHTFYILGSTDYFIKM